MFVAAVGSAYILHIEVGDAGPLIREALRYPALVFLIGYGAIWLGAEIGQRRGIWIGLGIAMIAYIVMLPTPQAHLDENMSAQPRLRDFLNWLEWLLAVALLASARIFFRRYR